MSELVSEVPEGKKGQDLGERILNPHQIAIPKMDPADTLRRTPHGGRPMVVVNLPEGVNGEEFKNVVAATYMAYIGGISGDEATKASGAPPTLKEVCFYVPYIPESRVSVIMGTKAYRQACEARGIATDKRPGLTHRQSLALDLILDPSAGKSLTQRLKKAGVKPAEYAAWKRNPVFRAHIENIGGRMLQDAEVDMLTTLKGLAVDGDLNAIKFAFEVTGKHDPHKMEVMNAQELMVQFMTIIQRHVKDPEALKAIGNDFLLLAGASGAAQPTQSAKPTIEVKTPLEIEER